ncbi:hypothetical protein lerEdw1_008504 [Lerista edwardsae]|nr:hypothetical protein lerEdw1_008504 [Lerista edwardsae]
MAGKLFPETYIGDSEDLLKKIPTGKKHCAPQRDLKSASPQSMDESHDSDNLADSAELKEQLVLENEGHKDGEVEGSKEDETKRAHSGHQKEEEEASQHHHKPQHRNLLDFGWLQEKEEEEDAHQDDLVSMTEDASVQEVVTKNSVCDLHEGIWPPPGDNTEEHLEPRVSEVALIDSFESDGKFTLSASTSGAEDLNSSPADHEGYQLCDDEDNLKDSSASTGYFPCYRTYVEFPRYQPPPSGEDSPPGKSEKQLGSCRDAGVQCDGCVEEGMIGSEKRGAEANNNSKEAKTLVAPQEVTRGQSGGGARPVSSGRKLEGVGGKHTRHLGDSGQEAGSNKKESDGGATKPRTPGSSPTRTSTKVGIAKDPQGSGPRTSQVPISTGARKSLQKRKHRTSRPDEKEQARLAELKPLLHDHRSLPPGPEEDTGILNACYGMEDAGINSEVRLVKARVKNTPKRNLSAQSCPSTTETSATPEPRPITSRLSLHSLVSWVRKIFRKPPSGQPQPSTSRGTETSRPAVGSRLRQWLTQHSSRIHPHPP